MDKEEIASALLEQVVRTPETGGPDSSVNVAMARLREELGFRQNTQLQVCRWSDFCTGRTNRLKYHVPMPAEYVGQNITKNRDSGGALTGRPESADLGDESRARQYVNEYLHELFRAPEAPLKAIGDMIDRLDLHVRPIHRATLSLDYFCVRPLEELGFHKDSTGNTLFVGLHYNNTDHLVGPEYLYDFWPRFEAREKLGRFSPHSIGTKEFDRGVSFWPKVLRDALEIARADLELQHGNDQDLIHVARMSPLGLISLVDELVYHQTPLTRYRERGENYGAFLAELSPRLRDRHDKPKLRRQFSEERLEEFWKDRGRGGQKYRSFIRYWIMIEPAAWHKA